MIITLKNFRCYEDKTFDFGETGLTLLSGSSGVGKSTILIAIYFCLYGTGTKLTSSGKTSCSVEMTFDGMKILRTKRPNRVVVDDTYEDQVAQDIINKRFGSTFDVTGYISQNAINSFIMMSPTDKLAFLEKFTFNDVDLVQIKTRCKAYISEKNNKLLAVSSQLRLTTEEFKDMIEPEEVKFPFKDGVKKIDKLTKNEEIRSKNCTTTIKKLRSSSAKVHQELTDIKVLLASTSAREESIASIDNDINVLVDENENLSYEGDEKLQEYQDMLAHVLLNKNIMSKQETLKMDIEKLEQMKENELSERQNKLQIIDDALKNFEFTKSDIENKIECGNRCLKIMNETVRLEKEIDKLGEDILSSEEIDELKNEREKMQLMKEEKKILIRKIIQKLESLNCPSCNASLRLDNDKLRLLEDMDDVQQDENELEILEKDVDEMNKNIKKLGEKIQKYEAKLDAYNKLDELISINLEKCPDTDIGGEKEKIKKLEKYRSDQAKLEEQKTVLENERFSSSYVMFSKNIEKQQADLNNKIKKQSSLRVDIPEEELRRIVMTQQENKTKIENIESRIQSLEDNREKYEKQLSELQSVHASKYSVVNDVSLLNDKLQSIADEISQQEAKKIEHDSNLLKISKYKQWQEKYDVYMSRKQKVIELTEKERIAADECSAATMLRDKILEAESIAMLNIISSINIHAQLYLDCFFPDNPIVVKLLPFKESKKMKKSEISKPQINIEIDYKGMDCDLSMLSGGELSRVILSYTLAFGEMFNSQLLLLDECTSSLDAETSNVVFDAIRDHYTGKLVVVVAHQVVEGIFDRTINLNEYNK